MQVRLQLWLVVVAVLLLTGAILSTSLPRAISQDSPTARTYDVAVMDVSRVFEKCTGFQQAMEQLKAEVKSFELVVTQATKDLNEAKQRYEAAEKGSPEYRALELEIATKNANLQVEIKVKREKFLADEAALYARWYRQVQKVVGETAARKSIRLVVKTSPESFDDKDRAAVLQAVNRPVVFQDQLDITDEVIVAVNAG